MDQPREREREFWKIILEGIKKNEERCLQRGKWGERERVKNEDESGEKGDGGDGQELVMECNGTNGME